MNFIINYLKTHSKACTLSKQSTPILTQYILEVGRATRDCSFRGVRPTTSQRLTSWCQESANALLWWSRVKWVSLSDTTWTMTHTMATYTIAAVVRIARGEWSASQTIAPFLLVATTNQRYAASSRSIPLSQGSWSYFLTFKMMTSLWSLSQ